VTGLTLWRISKFKDLQGVGGTVVSARWHNRGRPIVYLADCPATSLLEVLIHFELELDDLPESLTLLRADFPPTVTLIDQRDRLPAQWKDDLTATRRLGDEWLAGAPSLLLRVPTAIVPYNSNVLFNPLHPDAKKAKLSHTTFPLDPRLLNHQPGKSGA
jgi:RES domain-containing protein